MHARCVNRRIFWRDLAAWAKGGFVHYPILQHLIGQQDGQWLVLGKIWQPQEFTIHGGQLRPDGSFTQLPAVNALRKIGCAGLILLKNSC